MCSFPLVNDRFRPKQISVQFFSSFCKFKTQMKNGKEIFRIALTFAIVAVANAELSCRQVRPCVCSTEVTEKFKMFDVIEVTQIYEEIDSYAESPFISSYTNIHKTAMNYLTTQNADDLKILQRNIIFDWEIKFLRSRLPVYKNFLSPFAQGSEDSRCWACLLANVTGDFEIGRAMKEFQAFELVLNTANTVCNQCSSVEETAIDIINARTITPIFLSQFSSNINDKNRRMLMAIRDEVSNALNIKIELNNMTSTGNIENFSTYLSGGENRDRF